MQLQDCFREGSQWTDFLSWLAQSNHPKIRSFTGIAEPQELNKVVEESLKEILDILLREPLADYFWYNYPEHGGKLFYTVPSDGVGPVPGDALRVDKEKIKIFLRDIKIESILIKISI